MGEKIGWRCLILAMSVPTWLVAIAVGWLPESAHWYYTAGEFDKAEKLIKLVSTTNGKEPIEGRMVRESKDIQKRGQIKDLFVSQYRKTGSLLNFTFTTSVFVYFGISIISERLFEDYSLYISESVKNLSEFPAIAFGLLMRRISWRWMMINTRAIPAVALAVVALLYPYVTSVSYIWIANVILVFAARGLSLAACMIAITYYTVYYPTAVRATAVGFTFAISRLGVIVAMFIAEDLSMETALLILSITSFVCCGISFFLTDITIEKGITNQVDRTKRQTPEKKGAESSIPISSL